MFLEDNIRARLRNMIRPQPCGVPGFLQAPHVGLLAEQREGEFSGTDGSADWPSINWRGPLLSPRLIAVRNILTKINKAGPHCHLIYSCPFPLKQ